MSGELEDRVRRRIEDPAAGADMFVTVTLDYLGPAADHIPNDCAAGDKRKFLDYFGRKTARVRGKWAAQVHASNLPMTRRTVFARRGWAHASPRPRCITATFHAVERLDVAESKPLELRKIQSAASASDVSQRVASRIAVGCGIGSLADPDTIEDDYRGSFQLRTPVYTRSTRERSPVSSS
jgi:hypothetical protein